MFKLQCLYDTIALCLSLLMVNDKAIQRKSQTLSEGHGHLTEIIETHRKGTCSIKEDCNVLFFNSSKFSLMT